MSYCTDLLYGQGLTLCFPLRLLVEDVCTDLDAALDAIQGCCNLK